MFEGGQGAFVLWVFADFGSGRPRHERHEEVLWDVVARLENPVQDFDGQVLLKELEGSVVVRDFPGFADGVPSAPVDVMDAMQVLADESLGQVEGDVVGVVFNGGRDDT